MFSACINNYHVDCAVFCWVVLILYYNVFKSAYGEIWTNFYGAIWITHSIPLEYLHFSCFKINFIISDIKYIKKECSIELKQREHKTSR